MKTKKKRQKAVKRITKLDRITLDTATYHSHASTADVHRLHIILSCQSSVVESEIVTLRAKLADAQLRRAGIEAQLAGLAAVVGKR